MTLLWRILIALALALLGMQGAAACEHHHDAALQAVSVHQAAHANVIHCGSMSTGDASFHRTHSSCCMTACGVHCSALPSSIGMTTRNVSSDVPGVDSDPARVGVTRAPPVRPPIV